MSGNIHIVATLVAKPGQNAALQAALTGILADLRSEAGCLRYDLHHTLDRPARFLMLEAWADAEALEAHGNAAAPAGLSARFDALLVGFVANSNG